MRIISSFKDIYDNLQSQSEPIYVREKTVEYIKDISPNHLVNFRSPSGLLGCLIGFCGKIYPAFYIADAMNPHQHEVFFSAEMLFKKYPDILSEKNIGRVPRFNYHPHRVRNFLEYRNNYGWEYMGYDAPYDRLKVYNKFFSVSCPFFVITGTSDNQVLIRNPRCKKWELYKLFPIQQIFQEIEMYLGGMANPNKDIPPVSDIDMVTAKGFDKWSFRKEPTRK